MAKSLQTFQLDSPVHLLVKFHWNIKQLRSHLTHEDKAAAFYPAVYAAFDACITAWQLTDWVWKFSQQDGDVRLGDSELLTGRPLSEYQMWIREHSSDLRICQHIANSNKHFGVGKHYNANIKVVVDWQVESVFAAGMAVGRPLVDRSWRLLVNDSGYTHDILVILERAFRFWAKQIQPSLLSLLDE
ncbi:hypothetical protein [Pseudomonas farsensis]|uniref:Uncharacterized protein n=1 Tax=Pseudomonas farsensis TaxID=2745492 RepID=A0ABU8QN13_9PSED